MKPYYRVFTAFVLGLCICLVTACSEPQEPSETAIAIGPLLSLPVQPPSARLPLGVSPSHYTLQLNIDPRKTKFSGTTKIDITLTGSTEFFWMHGGELEVSSARAVLASGKTINLQWQKATQTGVVKVSAGQPLPAGKLQLHIEYSAPFNTSLEGLHTVTENGQPYAFTQFEAVSARLAFPSFDEPGFKVPFDISITIPAEFSGISNTPIVSETFTGEGEKHLTFATTKPLPTYLIAFAVGPFDVVEWEPVPAGPLRSRPLPLRGITAAGKGDEIRFALQNTAAIILEMEDYFDTPYPYAKLDIIAVPDFSSGAMENAGAITYREEIILMDETASVGQKRSFFYVHAHEISHQWFGNLVTPVWWEDIWLNESFATWNAHIILDRLFPDKKYRDALQSGVSRVMPKDALASARQIREPINRHEDIGSAFNGITYQKGSGVLSMFETFLGRDNFRAGIRHYMKVHAFGNTSAEDFIGAIADANPQVNGEELREAFRSFIEQPGVPFVTSHLNCSDKEATLEVSQQRYLPTGSTGSSDQTWVIPACMTLYEGDESSSQCFMLSDTSQTISLNIERCPEALLPNTGGTSYYRWSLPAQQWTALLTSFNDMSIPEQISIASSLSAALNNGSMSIEQYLQIVPNITLSESWRVAIAPRVDLYKIKDYVANDNERVALETKLRQLYQPRLDALNALASLRPDQEQFRMYLMSTLAIGSHDTIIRKELAEMGARFTGFGGDEKLHHEAIDPNLTSIALLVATDEYGKPFTDLLWTLFKASDNANDRNNLLGAMASSIDPGVAKIVRDRILSPDLKDNEVPNIIYSQMGRAENREAMWTWAQINLAELIDRSPQQRRGQLPSYFNTFCSTEHAAQIEAVFKPIINTLQSGPRNLANSLETVRLCAAFVDRHTTHAGI